MTDRSKTERLTDYGHKGPIMTAQAINYLIQGLNRPSQWKSSWAVQSAINTITQNEGNRQELGMIVAASGTGKSRLLNTGRVERISTKDIKPQFIIFDTVNEIDKLMKEKYTKFRQMDIKSIRYNFKGGK